MATVTLRHTWPDGSITEVSIEVRDSYPDCIAEARANARAALRDVIADFEGDA